MKLKFLFTTTLLVSITIFSQTHKRHKIEIKIKNETIPYKEVKNDFVRNDFDNSKVITKKNNNSGRI